MIQLGSLDFDSRLHRIDKAGDQLTKINETIDWELFRPTLEQARMKEKKSNAGAKGFDVVLLFKILVLQSLYNLSDESMEFQIIDRYSFPRFLGFYAASKVPDATTIWRFREDLAKAGTIETLFSQFDQFLHDHGFRAQKGQIIDASIVRVPVQRNSREENKQIKDGEQPQRKGSRNRKLTEWEKQGNWTRSKVRSRVELIFGVQTQRAGNLILRGVGIVRAKVKIGLRNLAYNLDRYGTLVLAHG